MPLREREPRSDVGEDHRVDHPKRPSVAIARVIVPCRVLAVPPTVRRAAGASRRFRDLVPQPSLGPARITGLHVIREGDGDGRVQPVGDAVAIEIPGHRVRAVARLGPVADPVAVRVPDPGMAARDPLLPVRQPVPVAVRRASVRHVPVCARRDLLPVVEPVAVGVRSRGVRPVEEHFVRVAEPVPVGVLRREGEG